jgi:hypothetical protein
MDLFDLVPIVPPGDSRDRSPGHQLAAGVGSVLFPTIAFIVVLLAGFAHDGTVALAVIPLLSGALLFVIARLLSVGVGWSLVLALYCAALTFVASGCALFLAAIGQFFQTF